MNSKAPVREVLFFFGILVCFLSCASNSGLYTGLDKQVGAASYAAALASMENEGLRKNIYSLQNNILFYLDRGMINHYAGFWLESSQDLEEGERLIEAAFTKSISQEIGSFILNDNVKDYPGEDYEDIYTNVFNALNYYHRDDLEGALVEIRRVNEKLRYLAGKYEIASQKVIDSTDGLSGQDYAVEATSFSNSALARYLSLLFFRSAGYDDNARIDLQELYRAYELAPAIYYHRPPSSLEDELFIPGGMTRLNVVGFIGLAPVKEEENLGIPLPLPAPNNWARLALPKMTERQSAVSEVEVVLSGGRRFNLELIEDISRVVRETFKAHYGLIVLKTVARAIGKSVTSAGIAGVVDHEGEGWGSLIGLMGRIVSDLSEGADLRLARYFPSRAYVGGINLEPGDYTITVNYYGRQGLIASEERSVPVKENKLNLVEFVCLR